MEPPEGYSNPPQTKEMIKWGECQIQMIEYDRISMFETAAFVEKTRSNKTEPDECPNPGFSDRIMEPMGDPPEFPPTWLFWCRLSE